MPTSTTRTKTHETLTPWPHVNAQAARRAGAAATRAARLAAADAAPLALPVRCSQGHRLHWLLCDMALCLDEHESSSYCRLVVWRPKKGLGTIVLHPEWNRDLHRALAGWLDAELALEVLRADIETPAETEPV